MRLNKFLAESGSWSRREADTLIEEGRVMIGDRVATLGDVIEDGDETVIRVDGERVGRARKDVRPVYIALNKPVGVTCTTERSVAGNIVDFVDHPERIFPIGRLDKDSEGLILLTNNGDIVNEVLRVEHAHEKEYLVAVDHTITPDFIAGMSAGVRLAEATTRPCRVDKLDARTFRIVLTQGLNRQIRRMSEAFGYEVVALRRVRIMHILLGNLAVGRWRNLSPAEIDGLMPAGMRRPGGGGDGGRPGVGDGRPGVGDGRPGVGGGRPGGGGGHPGGGRTGSGGGRPDSGGGRPGGGGGGGRPGGGRPGGGGGRGSGGGQRGRGGR